MGSDRDAEQVVQFTKDQEETFSAQRTLDELALRQYLQRHSVEMLAEWQEAGGAERGTRQSGPKPVGGGYGGLIVDTRNSFLGAEPFLRVNSPDDAHKTKAEQIEIGLQGIRKLSQASPVWQSQGLDVSLFGRGVTCLYPVPDEWAGIAFEQQEGEDDAAYNERIHMEKIAHFPIVWRHVSAQSTWPYYDWRGDLAEIVEIRQMTARQVAAAYGSEFLGPGQKPDSTKVDVYEYADREWCRTVIANSSRLAYEWPHRLGMVPYTFANAGRLPDNRYGYHWAGALFQMRYIIEEHDARLSDINFMIRKYTRSGRWWRLNTDIRGLDVVKDADPVKIGPDQQAFIYQGEEQGPLEPPHVNIDTYKFLEMIQGFSRDLGIRDALMGSLKGEETGVLYNTAIQMASRFYGPALEAMRDQAERWGKLALRCIRRMSEVEGVGAMDKLPIIFIGRDRNGNEKSYSIELGAKEVAGWENLIQARLDINLPLSEYGQVQVARAVTDPTNPLMDTEQAQSRYLGIESTQRTNQQILINQLVRAWTAQLGQFVAQRWLQIGQEPQRSPADLARMYGELPPDVQAQVSQFAQQNGGRMSPGVGGMLRGEANRRRIGVPQYPNEVPPVGP